MIFYMGCVHQLPIFQCDLVQWIEGVSQVRRIVQSIFKDGLVPSLKLFSPFRDLSFVS